MWLSDYQSMQEWIYDPFKRSKYQDELYHQIGHAKMYLEGEIGDYEVLLQKSSDPALSEQLYNLQKVYQVLEALQTDWLRLIHLRSQKSQS